MSFRLRHRNACCALGRVRDARARPRRKISDLDAPLPRKAKPDSRGHLIGHCLSQLIVIVGIE